MKPPPAAPSTPDKDMIPVRVEVAPGKMATMHLPRHKVGKFGLTKIVLLPDGTPQIIWKSWQTKVRLTRDLPRQLGLPVDVETLRCLCNAGIVKAIKFSPSVTLIDLDSLATHMEAASSDKARDYWKIHAAAYNEAWVNQHAQGMTHRQRREKPSKPAKAKPTAPAPAAKPSPHLRATAAPVPPPAPKKPSFTHPDLFNL